MAVFTAAKDLFSLKTGPEKHGQSLLKILQQLIHMNLSNYFFITDSIVLISTTCSLLAPYFMHEIREISNIVSYNKFSKPRPGRAGPVFRLNPNTNTNLTLRNGPSSFSQILDDDGPYDGSPH